MFQRFQRFMYGRYGGDTFSIFLMIFGLLISIISSFFFQPLVWLAYLIYGYVLFRALSKNLAMRRRENDCFLRYWVPLQNWGRYQQRKWRERKSFKYFACPNCHQKLRAPRKKGKIMVTCQKCHKQFHTKT